MSKILFEENELKKILNKIKRYEYRISQGESHLVFDCERLKIIRDKVHGGYRRIRILNAISLSTRRKINKRILLSYEIYSFKKQQTHFNMAS